MASASRLHVTTKPGEFPKAFIKITFARCFAA